MSIDLDVVDALAGFSEDLHGEGNFAMRLHDAVKKLKEERDELRAEVERLHSLKPVGTYSLDWNHEQERQRLTAERDAARAEAAAYKRDFEAELRGNAELRRQYGARGDETMFGFHARVAREREEALAEVKRLEENEQAAGEMAFAYKSKAETAFARGAEAMREAAASCVEREVDSLMLRAGLAADIRDLPIPEDK